MALQPTAAPEGSRVSDDQRVAAAQFICGTGSLLAVLAALGPTLGAVLYLFPSLIDQDPQNRGSGTWLDYGNFGIAALAWTIAVLLGWAAVGLAGGHGGWARGAGLGGAVLVCAVGLGICLSPLADPRMAAVGGWGQPWMPEVLIGGLVMSYGVLAGWLLLRARPPHLVPG
ncbi:MAG: hypothetical protein MUF33_10885 [Candidatus Nanopelagicales bacterium]|nr:hypothetical protein [Candidatus Nanopelagicales bacterium]